MKNYVLVALLIVLVISVMGVCFVSCANEVYAEELTYNGILNFNQIFKFSTGTQTNYGLTYNRTDYELKVSGTSNADNYVWFTFNDLLQVDHIYYFNISSIAPFKSIRYRTANSGSVTITENYYFIVKATSSTLQFALNHNSGVSFNNSYKPMLVDLTQMFGAGNEPLTIDDIKSYLPLDYYNYTTGTPVAYDTIKSYTQGYNNGINDVYSSMQYNIVATDSYNYLKPYGTGSAISSKYETVYNNQTYYCVQFKGSMIFEFNTTLNPGDRIVLSGIAIDYGNTSPMDIYYLTNNGLVLATSISFSPDGTYFSSIESLAYSFNLTQQVNALVFTCTDTNNGMAVLGNVEVTNIVNNVQTLIDKAYSSGQASINIDKIKTDSYQEGFKAGMEVDNPYTFRALITSVFDTPIRSLFGYKDTNKYLMDAYGRVILDENGNAVLNADYGHRVGGVLNFYIPEFDLDLSSLGMALITIALFVIIIKFTLGR